MTLLRLEGQLAGPWVGELEAACGEAKKSGNALSIDLGDVSMVDRAGFELLDRLAGSSAELVRCSPFQEEQLRQIARQDCNPR